MSKLKGRLRLIDPNEQEVSSDVGTDHLPTPEEQQAMESTLLQQLGAPTDADQDDNDASTAITAPRRTIRNRTAEEHKKQALAAEKAKKAAEARRNKSRTGGGLLSRLKTIRKKESTPPNASPAPEAAPSPTKSPSHRAVPLGPSTASPRASIASRASSRRSVPASAASVTSSAGPSTPTSPLPGPSETLGINAFQRHRVSTNASLVTSALLSTGGKDDSDDIDERHDLDVDSERATTPPALSSLQSHPLLVDAAAASQTKPDLLLRDQSVEKQPDLIETPSTHIRRSSTNRYSIAHSVEASLEDSWSIAERDEVGNLDDEDDDDDDDVTDDYRGVNWLKDDVEPPMVGGTIIGTGTPRRPARSERTVSAATMRTAREDEDDDTESEGATSHTSGPAGRKRAAGTAAVLAAAPALASKPSTVRTARSKQPAVENDDDDVDEGTQQDRQSDVNRLLKQLELGGAGAVAGSESAYTLDDDDDDVTQASASASGIGSEIYTRVSATETDPLYPDDSVSIRAAHRAAAQEQAEARALAVDDDEDDDDTAPTPTLARTRAAKPTDPKHLQAVLADIQPELESDSEGEDDEEEEDKDGATESSIRPPITARPRRRVRDEPPVNVRRSRSALRKSAVGNETWLLDSALTPEQYHYFTKAMVKQELQWEADRAFVFDPTDERRGTVDPPMKIKEFAVFKRSSLSSDNIPTLPMVRFLFDTVFCMLPAFGHARTSYEKRSQRAQVYWKRGVSPLLRILQSRSFSQRVDRYGQGNGKPFNAQGSGDILFGYLQRAAAAYITATLRLDGADDVKQAWPWPAPDLMKLPAFTPYRLPPEKQTRGGYEVDIACVRPGGTQTSYIISVRRRFGHPLSFVLRSEEQFYELGKALFLSLPGSCVKPPPSLDMAVVKLYDGSSQAASNVASSTAVAREQSAGSSAKRNGKVSQEPAASSKGPSSADKTTNGGQGAAAKPSGLAGLFGSLGRSSGASGAKGSGASAVSGVSTDDGSATTTGSPSEIRDAKKRASLLGSRTSLPQSSSHIADETRSSATDLGASKGNGDTSTAAGSGGKTTRSGGLFGLGSQAPPPTPKVKAGSIDYALRRLQLRDWLRDALSARGVGHHPETRNFFSVGAFTERDLKRSTKEKIENNRRADEVATKQREEIASDAGEEVLDLQDQIDAMWEECKSADGFLRAKAVFQKSATFSGLPEDYQRLVTYAHLQFARLLDGMFITGDQSANNFRRAKAILETIPWKLLKVVMSEPTGLMIADLKRTLSHPSFIGKLLSAAMQDDPRRIEDGLSELKARLPSIYLRKLRRFVEVTPDDTKRLIRDHAVKAGIPLVAAIERGSDSPLLEGRELSRIIKATETWNVFMESGPTAVEVQVEAGRNRDVALIRDLQQALRLYSLRRDGANMRDLVRSKTFRNAVESLVQPLLDYVAKLHHRRRPLKRFVRTAEMRLHSLFELIEALRNRVHDPARSIEGLTTYFDSHVQDSMALIRILSPLFTTLHHMAQTVSEGSGDLAREWSLPSSINSFSPLNDRALNNIKALTDSAWLQRIRAMEVTSRWIAGDLEADREVQVIGGEGELSRTAQILPDEPEVVELDREALFKPFGSGFRAALSKVLA